MTFEEYIKNPMGDRNAVISHREMYRTMYTDKYNKIMLRENNKVNYKIYKHKQIYYIHIKVPSEVVLEFYYDVVIKFVPTKLSGIESTIKNYDVQFYSNDPSFVFTFAHAFIKANLFIKELTSRMSKKAVKERPKEKNPREEISYVKSLYFAFLIMKDKGLFSKAIIDPMCLPYNEAGLIASIEPADKKIEDRQTAGAELIAKKRKEQVRIEDERKRDIKKIDNDAKNSQNNIHPIKKIGSIGKNHYIKPINSRSKKMKKIGRI